MTNISLRETSTMRMLACPRSKICLITALCFAAAGCGQPTVIQELKTNSQPYQWRLAEGESLIFALAHRDCVGDVCKTQFNDPDSLSPRERAFRSKAVEGALTKLTNASAIDLSTTGVGITPDERPESVCEKLSVKGYRGRLVVVGTGTSEMFGIGHSTGVLHVSAEVWDINHKVLDYGQECQASARTPLMWRFHFIDLSGDLSDSGRLAFCGSLEKTLN